MAHSESSELAVHADLAAVLRAQATQAGATSSSVRGSDWRQAIVAAINTDGTIVTSDGIVARRLAAYANPTVGDVIIVTNSSIGNWLAVGRMTTSTDAVGQMSFAYKAADTSRTATTTRAADPHLTLTVSANAVYAIDASLYYVAATTGDLDMAFTVPTGASGSWAGHGAGLSAAGSDTNGYTLRTELNTVTQNRGFGGTGSNVSVSIRGLLRTTGTAGAFTLVWSQRVSDPTATTLFADSWLRLQRIA